MKVASVITCTRNPRRDYLQGVFEALREQTLRKDKWELLVIDNASTQPLAKEWDLSWHPSARHIREDELGLTPARLRGIAEAQGEILVFVDDDNVLDPDYLQTAVDIGCRYPFLGAWGGTIKGKFEREPEPWMSPLLEYFGIRKFSSPVWSNNPDDWKAQPCGAGLCIRRFIATVYAKQVEANPARLRLDRIGPRLFSCGDSDLVWTSCDLGHGFGNFPGLHLKHLIPASRVHPQYIIDLMQGIVSSMVILQHLRTGHLPAEPSPLRVWFEYAVARVRRGRHPAWIYRAYQDAIREGIRMARKLGRTKAFHESPLEV